MKMTKTYGLTHVAIAVRDLEQTERFYQAVFDMQVMYHERNFIQLTTPDCHDILVFELKENVSIGDSGGIIHFGFRLRNPEDIEGFEQKITEAGGHIVDKGEFVPGSPYIFFKDPNGYQVEIWYEKVTEAL